LTEREALTEFVCRLLDSEKLPLWPAAKLAGLSRPEMEDELRRRGIATYRPTIENLFNDVAVIERLREG
jgi:predicted HTH domain antitoxin